MEIWAAEEPPQPQRAGPSRHCRRLADPAANAATGMAAAADCSLQPECDPARSPRIKVWLGCAAAGRCRESPTAATGTSRCVCTWAA